MPHHYVTIKRGKVTKEIFLGTASATTAKLALKANTKEGEYVYVKLPRQDYAGMFNTIRTKQKAGS